MLPCIIYGTILLYILDETIAISIIIIINTTAGFCYIYCLLPLYSKRQSHQRTRKPVMEQIVCDTWRKQQQQKTIRWILTTCFVILIFVQCISEWTDGKTNRENKNWEQNKIRWFGLFFSPSLLVSFFPSSSHFSM